MRRNQRAPGPKSKQLKKRGNSPYEAEYELEMYLPAYSAQGLAGHLYDTAWPSRDVYPGAGS